MSGVSFLYPGTLLPIFNLYKTHPGVGYIPPKNSQVANYVALMGISNTPGPAGITHCPAVSIGNDSSKTNTALKNIYRILENGRKCGGENAFKYLMGESADNILEHSQSTSAYMMGQSYARMGFTEICIFDDGISIPGIFEKTGFDFKYDCSAIKSAIMGKSTKEDVSGARGFGLGSSLKILVDGLNGEGIIISRNGAVYVNSKLREYYNLSDPRLCHKGTLISLRIPFSDAQLDITEYVTDRIKMD